MQPQFRNMRNRDFQETRTPAGVVGGLVGLVAASAAAATLVTVAITPAIAAVGVATSSTISMFENLPSYLDIGELSEKSNIYATRSDGSVALLASFYDQNRVEVGWDQINQYVKDAAIAGEDPRFYEHSGVDLQGTLRAAATTATGRETQGGSSIAQQYVKNVRVQECERDATTEEERDGCYDAVTETTIDRKLKEMRLAIGIEKRYTKSEILLGYLNIAGFGGTVYGIEAAANYYYGTSAKNLTLPQAASLMAIVNNPGKFRIDQPDDETNGTANGYADNTSRRDYILKSMLEERKITREEYDAAVATPVEPKITEPSTGCQTAAGSAYFCDYVKHVLQNDPTFGEDEETRLLNFRRGGYDVYTTLDLDLQVAAEQAMARHVPATFPGWDVGGVISSVEVGTGRVLAMAQNRTYSQDPDVLAQGPQFTSINYNTDYAYGGSRGFQPGSSYKVFTLAEWLSSGHGLAERVDSRPKSNWGVFQDSCLGPQFAGDWNPKNDAGESGGNYSAMESTINSINTGFIGMAKRLDLCNIRKRAEAFGVHRADGDPLAEGPSSVIGTNEVAPLSMAVAFAGIANNGTTCTPIAIDRIVGRDGEEIPPPKSTCTQSVLPEVAAAMHTAMGAVMTGGTGRQSNQNVVPSVPLIGKTGTTDGAKDTWMVGASSKVATAVAVVSVNGEANQRGIDFATGQAATARHRMWPEVMSVAAAKYGGDPFSQAGMGPVTGPGSSPDGSIVPGQGNPTPTPTPTDGTPAEPPPSGGTGPGNNGNGNGNGNRPGG
ncbi:transglycosylase domain-containing protein [Agromyces aurantiacus]|uniref:Transglycosylase domain-containing protein n=1 Tax=Agromyces aurantiacus TaxID=165814 RepID=A0ABV9R787_9MICO|nr:transglycosylase domain-containing protein [Agromyces aurantiacus]MBM7505101.1 membrane peptidoglycan carboxypeptidase [Agromyces aurantiacus]